MTRLPAVPTVDGPVIDVANLVAPVGEHIGYELNICDRAVPGIVPLFLHLDMKEELAVLQEGQPATMRQFKTSREHLILSLSVLILDSLPISHSCRFAP